MSEPSAPLPAERPPAGNGMGVAGFVVSLVGLFTCGVLSPVGLVLSVLGLGREPKGLAIAGTVIGGLGTLLVPLTVLGVIAGLAVVLLDEPTPPDEMQLAVQAIEVHAARTGEFPSVDEGDAIIAEFTDEWGNGLRYEPDDDTFAIRSAGPDAVFDTDDDIVSTGEHPRER